MEGPFLRLFNGDILKKLHSIFGITKKDVNPLMIGSSKSANEQWGLLKPLFKESQMTSRTITTIGIIAAILMTISGADFAFARGGGGKGSGKGPGANSGAGMSQVRNTYQYKYNKQNQYQYRKDNGTPDAQFGNRQMLGDQSQQRIQKQLRDPDSHVVETME